MKPGDSVSYRVRVADNRPAPRGPNVVWSPLQTLAIVATAEPLRVRASRARATRSAQQARIAQERRGSRPAEDGEASASKPTPCGAAMTTGTTSSGQPWRNARRPHARLKISSSCSRATSSATRGCASSRAKRTRLPRWKLEAARAAIEQAGRESDAAARHAGLERAVGRLAAVSERLENLTHKLDAKAREAAEMNRLGELAKREEELAAAARDTNGDRASRDRVAAEQQAVRNELDALLRKTPALRGLVLRGEIREAERLAGRVRGPGRARA